MDMIYNVRRVLTTKSPTIIMLTKFQKKLYKATVEDCKTFVDFSHCLKRIKTCIWDFKHLPRAYYYIQTLSVHIQG